MNPPTPPPLTWIHLGRAHWGAEYPGGLRLDVRRLRDAPAFVAEVRQDRRLLGQLDVGLSLDRAKAAARAAAASVAAARPLVACGRCRQPFGTPPARSFADLGGPGPGGTWAFRWVCYDCLNAAAAPAPAPGGNGETP